MYKFPFSNRTKELNFIKKWLTNNTGYKSNVLLVQAATGWGKTRLINRFFELNAEYSSIRVKIQNNSAVAGEEEYYIRMIAKEFAQYAEIYPDKILPIDKYLERINDISIIKEIIFAFGEAFVKKILPSDSVSTILSKIRKVSEFNPDMIFSSQAAGISRESYKYLCNAAQDKNIVVIIENSQNFDKASLDKIKNLLKSSFVYHVIFEYTESANYQISPEHLIDYLENENVYIESIHLDYLALSDLDKEIEAMVAALLKALDTEYKNSEYNIRDIERKVGKILSEIERESPRHQKICDIDMLTDEQKLIIGLLAFSDGRCKYDKLIHLMSLDKPSKLDIEHSIQSALRSNYIVEDRGCLSIDHDSTYTKVLGNDAFIKTNLLAAKLWNNYFTRILDNGLFGDVNLAEVLKWKLYVTTYLNNSDEILKTIKLIRINISQFSNPTKLKDYIASLLSNIGTNVNNGISQERIKFEFIGMYYDIGQLAYAEEILNKTTIKPYIYKLFKFMIKVDETSYTSVIDEIQNELNEVNYSSQNRRSYELCLKLIEISLLRNYSQYNLANRYYVDLIAMKYEFEDLPEYYLLLRFAHLALDTEDAIPLIEESLKISRANNAYDQISRTLLMLSLHYGETGRLSDAKSVLDEVQNMNAKTTIDSFTLNNNWAVIDFLQNNVTLETSNRLQNARLTVYGDFNNLIILINTLIYNRIVRNHSECESLINLIMAQIEISKDLDGNIKNIAYFNISKYFNDIEDKINHDKYISKIYTEEYDFDYWNYRKTNQLTLSIKNDFRIKYDFDPPFMAHWTIDIGTHLYNFE